MGGLRESSRHVSIRRSQRRDDVSLWTIDSNATTSYASRIHHQRSFTLVIIFIVFFSDSWITFSSGSSQVMIHTYISRLIVVMMFYPSLYLVLYRCNWQMILLFQSLCQNSAKRSRANQLFDSWVYWMWNHAFSLHLQPFVQTQCWISLASSTCFFIIISNICDSLGNESDQERRRSLRDIHRLISNSFEKATSIERIVFLLVWMREVLWKVWYNNPPNTSTKVLIKQQGLQERRATRLLEMYLINGCALGCVPHVEALSLQ